MPQNGECGLESVSLNPVDSSLLENLENINTRWLLRSCSTLWFIIYINNSLERRCGMMMILQLYVLYLLNIIYYEPQFSFINTCGHTLYSSPFAKRKPPLALIPHAAFPWIFVGPGPPCSCLWRPCFFGTSANESPDTCMTPSLTALRWVVKGPSQWGPPRG